METGEGKRSSQRKCGSGRCGRSPSSNTSTGGRGRPSRRSAASSAGRLRRCARGCGGPSVTVAKRGALLRRSWTSHDSAASLARVDRAGSVLLNYVPTPGSHRSRSVTGGRHHRAARDEKSGKHHLSVRGRSCPRPRRHGGGAASADGARPAGSTPAGQRRAARDRSARARGSPLDGPRAGAPAPAPPAPGLNPEAPDVTLCVSQ